MSAALEAQFATPGFSAAAFIDGLTRQTVHERGTNRLETAAALVSRFSDAMKAVEALEASSSAREKELAQETERAHAVWEAALSKWSAAHVTAVGKVEAAAKQLAAEGEPRLHLAERLRGLERDLKRTEEAREVLEKIRALNEGREAYKLQDEAQARRAAQLMRVLMRVAEDLPQDRFAKAREGAKALQGATEKRLLELFDEALSDEDTAHMALLASSLAAFQGGLSCSRLYISRLSFFFDEVVLKKDADAAQQTVKDFQVASEDAKAQQEQTVRGFFNEVGASCVQQWQEISAIFPEPVAVMALLLERVFQQRIRNFFDETQRIGATLLGPAVRLRMQAACFSHAASLTETLWQRLTPAVASSLQIGPLFQNLLGPERDLYIERELRWLQEHYREVIESECELVKREESFFRGLVAGDAAPQSVLRTMSLEIALDMIHANESALSRSADLSPMGEAPHNAYRIFSLLLRFVGDRYAGRVLTTITDALPEAAALKGPPSLAALEEVQRANHIVVLLQRHYVQRVTPQVAKSLNEQTNCGIERAAALDALEAAVDALLMKLLSLVLAHVERLLAHQKKSDWRVKEEDEATLAAEDAPSRACASVCAFIGEVTARAQATLDGRNVTAFLAEVATRLQRALWTHIRQFTVSAGLGGMRLMRDMAEYRELVRRMQVPPLIDEGFAQLKEAANIFVVPPANLRPLLEESSLLARLPATERVGLVRQRTDFKNNWIGRYL